MSEASRRPAHVKPPAHWKMEPVPAPEATENEPEVGRDGPDPTRYGDWEKKGIAIDF